MFITHMFLQQCEIIVLVQTDMMGYNVVGET